MPRHGEYTAFIKAEIAKTPEGDPIFTRDLSEAMASAYGLDITRTKPMTSVIIKRFMDNNTIPELRYWRRGIYYRTKPLPVVGEKPINRLKVFSKRFLDAGSYETADSFANKLGLTTRIPTYWTFATNATKSIKRDPMGFPGYKLIPPRVPITDDNRQYLQILDLLEAYDTYPIDTNDPYDILAKHVQQSKLNTDLLLKTSEDLYSDKAIRHLCHVFSRMIAGESSNQTD